MYSVGDYVWVKQESSVEFNVPKGCKICKVDGDKIQVQDEEGEVEWITPDRIINQIHASSIDPVDDMIDLGDLQECVILRNLHIRYRKQLIYTYIGDMLIAVNPYQALNIYSSKEVSRYSERKSETLPPHIFATSERCFSTLKNTKRDQCILISGESGAGKTESTKLILQYLTSISAGSHSWIKQQILEANPILEAFGNAKTQKNDNSSRFGKYINLYFNYDGEIEGARIDYYLLEKSRIVTQLKNERNYHIFYALLEGLTDEEKKKLYLGKVSDYRYLQGMGKCKDRDDARTFSNVKSAMQVLKYNDETCNNVAKLLAMILHMGNLKYKETTVAHDDATEIDDDVYLKNVSEFVGVNKEMLISVLTKRCIFAQGEKVVSNLSKDQALEIRDAFAKIIYEKVFERIVKEMNNTIYNSKARTKNMIGILDLSGFENFDTNSFEQLCINYANEHLQQFFVQHIFKIEQENYIAEGIDWTNIDFVDNRDIIDLIGTKPLNIMSLIDEESIFPKGSDSSLLSKICLIHRTDKNFIKPKTESTCGFGIVHFAGTVQYSGRGFLDKNRDIFSSDFKQLISSSSNNFLKSLFTKNELSMNGEANKFSKTLSTKFRESLESLLNTLNNCHPFFIRCIKPNENQLSNVFDRTLCIRQLRYTGLTDTARIRQAGFPLRYSYIEFFERFHCLAHKLKPSQKLSHKYITEQICNKFPEIDRHSYRFGHTKMFLKDHFDMLLERERSRTLNKYAVILQKNARTWFSRRRYAKMKKSAVTIQKLWRGYGPRQKFLKIRQGIHRLQARMKSRYVEADFQKKRRSIVSVQALCRGYLTRNLYKEKRKKILMERKQSLKTEIKIEATKIIESEKRRASDPQKQNKEPESIDTIFNFLDHEPKGAGSRFTSNELGPVSDVIGKNTISRSSFILTKEISESEIMSYDFYKFAATYFIGNTSLRFSKKPLMHPLLDHPHVSDQLAAKALSITIMRFMGDSPEPENSIGSYSNKPVMETVIESMSKNMKAENHFLRMTLRKKNKFNDTIIKGITHDEYDAWLDSERTNLEKLHFIIGHGILRPELKDEIYCQIVKQLTENPSKDSHAKGWVLLALCVGCFAPSEKLIHYLKTYIKFGPPQDAPFCEQRLMRTYRNGPRTQPPCWIEMQSVKYNQPILLKVEFADGNFHQILADSASTAQEIMEGLADKIKLEDTFGFSLFISIDDKFSSLGSERVHVMDAVSQCEQYAKEQGFPERDAPWKLSFRKEIFAPWHDPTADEVATDLIYQQISKGFKMGEYRCHNTADIAKLIAKQMFVYYCSKSVPKNLPNILKGYIPNHLLQGNAESISKLEKMVAEAYEQEFNISEYINPQKIKEKVVSYAKNEWSLLFSKLYETKKIYDPKVNLDDVIVAVNSAGVYFFDDNERLLRRFSYPEVSEINYQKNDIMLSHNIIISLIQTEELIYQSLEAESLVSLVNYLIDGLKERSTYAIAIQDSSGTENDQTKAAVLPFARGDVIKLINGCNGSTVLSSPSGFGENKNGIKGELPSEWVYVLPILREPSAQLLEIFKSDATSKTDPKSTPNKNAPTPKFYTLEQFAIENFRQSIKDATPKRRISVTKMNIGEVLWRHSRETMKAPLLASLANKKDEFTYAVQIFTNILKYMGDLPSNIRRIGTDLTDLIFGPALSNELLRDEVYCQIMRQLTENRINISEERGWELMWLATGIMPCSTPVRIELEHFLKSRDTIFARDCLARLKKIIESETVRIYPPCILEVEAIRFKNSKIFHKVYFPDSTDAAFEVHSSTRARDLCEEISEKLQLRSRQGFTLYFKIADRLISMPQYYFFFDFVREIDDWASKMELEQPDTQYQVLFKKKIWIDCLPGRDKNADTRFYFYQEGVNYLRGYHKCSKKDATDLAALIYISGHGDNKAELSRIDLKLQEYVPADMLDLMTPKEWKKRITSAYNQNKNLDQDEAKERFLQCLYQWPTFGSAFFDLHQTTEPKFPEYIIVAINKNGISIVDPHTKDVLALYSFTEISNWSSGNTYFHMTIGGTAACGRKILCKTTLGYKMDDLITSYIDYLQGKQI